MAISKRSLVGALVSAPALGSLPAAPTQAAPSRQFQCRGIDFAPETNFGSPDWPKRVLEPCLNNLFRTAQRDGFPIAECRLNFEPGRGSLRLDVFPTEADAIAFDEWFKKRRDGPTV